MKTLGKLPIQKKPQETQDENSELRDKLRAIIARDQDWETVSLTSYGTVVKYKK